MESRIKKYIQEAILEKYSGTDPDLDIDWAQLQIAFNTGIKEVVEWLREHPSYQPKLDAWGGKICDIWVVSDGVLKDKLKEWGI